MSIALEDGRSVPVVCIQRKTNCWRAFVWDQASRRLLAVKLTRPTNPDPDPGARREARRWARHLFFRSWNRWNEQQAREPEVGKRARVVGGAVLPIGTEGVVSACDHHHRVAILLLGERQHRLAVAELEVVNWKIYLHNPRSGVYFARRRADRLVNA